MDIYLLPTFDPCTNLATEEYLLTNRKEDILLLWRNDNTIVVGRNQNTSAEINARFVEERHIRVVRRITGGGAVYHDLNNVNFSFLTTVDSHGFAKMEQFTLPVANALRSMGVNAEITGRNDIAVEGKKISGNAQALVGNRLLHHGTLLFDFDGSTLEQALLVHPEKLRSHGVASVRSRVVGLKQYIPHITINDFIIKFASALTNGATPKNFIPTQEESQAVKTLAQKYASWEWTYGKTPPCELNCRKKFAGGIIEAHLNIAKGVIRDAVLFGDFMSLRPVSEVCSALQGIPYTYADVRTALKNLTFADYFGTITLDEVLECLFCDERNV